MFGGCWPIVNARFKFVSASSRASEVGGQHAECNLRKKGSPLYCSSECLRLQAWYLSETSSRAVAGGSFLFFYRTNPFFYRTPINLYLKNSIGPKIVDALTSNLLFYHIDMIPARRQSKVIPLPGRFWLGGIKLKEDKREFTRFWKNTQTCF